MRAEPVFAQWEGFAIKKQGAEIFLRNFRSYETRNDSTLRLIQNAIARYGVKNFDWVVVNTGDFDRSNVPDANHCWVQDDQGEAFPLLAYSTSTKQFGNTLPDFVFDHWKQTGLNDYEQTRGALKRFDFPQAATPCLGWRGALTHPSRSILVGLDDKVNFDCELIRWDRSNPDQLTASNFLSFEQQVAQWRYLIDMRGVGYSGRLKLLLSSPRVVFLQERVYEEYFFPHLKAWVHYVPVKEDLSDLQPNLDLLRSRPGMEAEILKNAAEFSQLYLTRDYAIFKMAKLFESLG